MEWDLGVVDLGEWRDGNGGAAAERSRLLAWLRRCTTFRRAVGLRMLGLGLCLGPRVWAEQIPNILRDWAVWRGLAEQYFAWNFYPSSVTFDFSIVYYSLRWLLIN
jgi:hypothetical protein